MRKLLENFQEHSRELSTNFENFGRTGFGRTLVKPISKEHLPNRFQKRNCQTIFERALAKPERGSGVGNERVLHEALNKRRFPDIRGPTHDDFPYHARLLLHRAKRAERGSTRRAKLPRISKPNCLKTRGITLVLPCSALPRSFTPIPADTS